MPSGVRAELMLYEPTGCPVVNVASETDSRVTGVSWTRPAESATEPQSKADVEYDSPVADGVEANRSVVVEKFRVPVSEAEAVIDAADPVVDINDRRVYRLEYERDRQCACERIEALGCPVDNIRATGETVRVTLHLPALDTLGTIVQEIAELAEQVEVRSLVQNRADVDAAEQPVIVDRGQLTDRQREVLAMAVEMGYFEHPRDSNGTEVAAKLGIDISTFTQHLAAAQSKLFDGMILH